MLHTSSVENAGTDILKIVVVSKICMDGDFCSSGGAKKKFSQASSLPSVSVRLKACEFHMMMPLSGISRYTPSGKRYSTAVCWVPEKPTELMPRPASPGPKPMQAMLVV